MRTLIVENDVPFDVVGTCWVFTAKNAAKVKDLWAAHVRKLEKRGLRVPGPRQAKASA